MGMARPLPRAVAVTVLGVALAGCSATTDLVEPCCYRGDVALTHLADTRLTLETGTTVAFTDVFRGFRADPHPLARVFPFRSADIRLVAYPSLRDVLPKYDANGDHYLQVPELTALYVREAARGLGFPVVRIDPSGRNGAIATSGADMSALVRFVEDHLGEMAPAQRKIFRDLVRLGQELKPRPILLDDLFEQIGLGTGIRTRLRFHFVIGG